MNHNAKALQKLIASMAIFGTVGIFRRWIPLPSATVAAARGIVGALFLLALQGVRKQKLSRDGIRQNLVLLLVSGAAMGANWIALFEAYRFTTVAAATLCYYMAPVLVILLSPLLLREKLTARKGVCAAAALLGMALVSGLADGGGLGTMRGALLGLLAAALYASVVLMNKQMCPMPAIERAVVQLLVAGVVVLPYALLTGGAGTQAPGAGTLLLLAAVCIVHTGLAYALYFGSVEHLPAHTLALLSYIDPVVAVLLSALLLHEPLTILTGLGAVLILGAAAVGELPERKKEE